MSARPESTATMPTKETVTKAQTAQTRRLEASSEQIALSTRHRGFAEKDGLTFRDLDGDGELAPFEDWRLDPRERAADLAARMSPDEKVGLMVICSRPRASRRRTPS